MHSDSKKCRSFLAMLFATGDVRRSRRLASPGIAAIGCTNYTINKKEKLMATFAGRPGVPDFECTPAISDPFNKGGVMGLWIDKIEPAENNKVISDILPSRWIAYHNKPHWVAIELSDEREKGGYLAR